MKWIPVNSTTIATIGYDALRRELRIKFRLSGAVYVYFDVSPEEYEAFVGAGSKGQHLNEVFKARGHRYITVHEGGKRTA